MLPREGPGEAGVGGARTGAGDAWLDLGGGHRTARHWGAGAVRLRTVGCVVWVVLRTEPSAVCGCRPPKASNGEALMQVWGELRSQE